MSDNSNSNSNSDNTNKEKRGSKYLGNLQEKKRQSGDKYLIGTLCVDDIENVSVEHIQTARNGKRYIRVIVNPYKNGANEYGNTHSIAVDTYKPKDNNANANQGGEQEAFEK